MKARPRWLVTTTAEGSILGLQQFAVSLAHVYAIVEAAEDDAAIATVHACQLRPDGRPVPFASRLWVRDADGALIWPRGTRRCDA